MFKKMCTSEFDILFLFIYMKILQSKIINSNYYFNNYFHFLYVGGYCTSYSYKILSLSTISTPTLLDDLKECNEYTWVI
jgi:hypothetical protein